MDNLVGLLDHPNYNFSEADFLDWDALAAEVERADHIYHGGGGRHVPGLAEPHLGQRVNAPALNAYFNSPPRTTAPSSASSSSVYGHGKHPELIEDMTCSRGRRFERLRAEQVAMTGSRLSSRTRSAIRFSTWSDRIKPEPMAS